MIRFLLSVLLLIASLLPARAAEAGTTNLTAETILARVLANRPLKDFSLKARLFVTRDDPRFMDLLIKNLPTETRTIFRSGKTELLSIQPVHGISRLFLRGTGELTGTQRMESLTGSHFHFYDLSLPFLHWSNPKLITKEDRVRGRNCFTIEATATNEPYARVKMWIDQEFYGFLRAEAYNADGDTVKRFAVTSFKHLGDYWIPRSIEVATVPPGQSLPAEERSRLEIYEGNYDTKLPEELFLPEKFGAAKP